ncbi:hypothetical protein AYO46_08800 [Betaproteobacteria bacterium SCGC AG-212-J23]|nr:hypothetical protein AYO46_08800 [Betaproteobacteria bacterium SCGC AG-212-J23]
MHGIGTHSKTWVDDKDAEGDEKQSFAELFQEKWDEYPQLKNKSFKLHSICYDDEINKIFQLWQDYAKQLKDQLKTSPLLAAQAAWFNDAVDEAVKAKGESNFGYTHLMDLLLFAGSPTLQKRLVTYAGNQVIKLIQQYAKDDDISILGHSMGCAMTHKVVQALYNEGVETQPGKFETIQGDFRFVNVTLVANTSYSLSRDQKKFYLDRLVRPSSKAEDGCSYTWLNVNHQYDPVGRFMPFDCHADPAWLDPVVATAGDYLDIVPKQLTSKSIHALTHYFRDPGFHIPYFKALFGVKFSDKDIADAHAAFENLTPEGKFKGLVSHLEQIDLSDTSSLKTLFVALKDFYALIK